MDAGIAYSPAQWANFFSAEVGASAALTGLLFVAISINLSKIISHPQLTARSAKTLATLAGVLLAATLCLVPGISAHNLGWILAFLGAANWLVITVSHVKATKGNPYATVFDKIFHSILAQLSVLPLVVAGVSLAVGRGGGLYWLVGMTLASFIAALLDAWVLLIEIQR